MRSTLQFRMILLFIVAGLLSCNKQPAMHETRSFYMGVTPWPADFTIEEVDNSYDFINNNCDIVSHHFDDGIPYEEAFTNQSMPARLEQEVQNRKTKTDPGKKIFLSVSALNLTRKEKADYYSEASVTDSIKNYWKQLSFNDPKIVTAYVNYLSWLIEQFQPAYINYGVESNLPLWNVSSFNLYKDFLSKVYTQVKARYPSLPLFISFMVDESAEGLNYASQLLPYTDMLGLSAYPYVSISSSADGNTDPALFPANYFERFINLDASKPFVFAETGYIAENLSIPFYSLNKQGNESWQKDYLEKIFGLCNKYKAELLIWFCHKDYDAANIRLRQLGKYQDLFGFWEDTGLIDETGKERLAYQSWLEWMKKVRSQ